MDLIAWKNVEQLREGVTGPPRRRLVVGAKGAQAGTPAPPRVLFVLEEADARLLGVDLEGFPEEPVAVRLNLEILE